MKGGPGAAPPRDVDIHALWVSSIPAWPSPLQAWGLSPNPEPDSDPAWCRLSGI